MSHAIPDSSPASTTGSRAATHPAPPSWPWRRAALLLSGAAQLITISLLEGADPPPGHWSSVLLAIVPALVAALAAFAPSPLNLGAAVVGCVILVIGIAGAWNHTGLFFVPALIALMVGAVKLWQERRTSAGG